MAQLINQNLQLVKVSKSVENAQTFNENFAFRFMY